MRFARVEGNDDALVFRIDRNVLNAIDLHQHRTQSSNARVAILAVGRDLDLLQNRMIGALRKKGISRFGFVWSCRVHIKLIFRGTGAWWLYRTFMASNTRAVTQNGVERSYSNASRYLMPEPVLKITTLSPLSILYATCGTRRCEPARRSILSAAKQAAPSGATNRPSLEATSRATRIIS